MTISVKRAVKYALIGVLLLILFVFIFLSYRGIREPDSETMHTSIALNRLIDLLRYYKAENGSYPTTLQEAIAALEKDGVYYNIDSGVVITKPGRDGWGRELIYELRDPEHVVVRSMGANGVDENGQGDDIQRVLEY